MGPADKRDVEAVELTRDMNRRRTTTTNQEPLPPFAQLQKELTEAGNAALLVLRNKDATDAEGKGAAPVSSKNRKRPPTRPQVCPHVAQQRNIF